MNYAVADILNNPNIGVVIAQEIEKQSWKKSPFEPLSGLGSDRAVRGFTTENDQPYRPRLKTQLSGDGVEGNADFETNYDEMEILCQTITPKVVGNSLRSPIEQYTRMQSIDFVRESKDSLSDWMMNKRDKQFIAHLTNDLTNCVVADQTDGYKDTTQDRDVKSAAKRIVKGDVINVKLLRRAIFMARIGQDFRGREIYPLKPTRSETTTNGGISIMHYSYLILLDTHGINQLKNDKEWQDMQKYAGDRGEKNALFTGLAGMIDGCPVLDFNTWSKAQAGLMTSAVKDNEFLQHLNKDNVTKIVKPSEYADTQEVAIGFLLGASALVMVGSTQPTFYIEKVDAGRKTKIGADRLLGIAKAKFGVENEHLANHYGKDFATIGIFYSKE